ncbi:hypothetical protein HUW51_01050 (plasmid) [Adhaeribacter swui]|uniref:Uncharacterized protein n=1 Tax=Adhaeribacter swui TaxID=2086471 RepID=A0A7G7G2J1_9BACT|nr:hypothetical protein [Adhaeribacter swui]QNF31375.1 hypothetical protein HUW51_01050 [Adhaeribacter swui]
MTSLLTKDEGNFAHILPAQQERVKQYKVIIGIHIITGFTSFYEAYQFALHRYYPRNFLVVDYWHLPE